MEVPTLVTTKDQPWAPSWEAWQKMQKEPKVFIPKPTPIQRLWDSEAEPVEVMGLRNR